MAVAKKVGYFKPYTHNSKADRKKNKQFFFHGKDSTESEERLDRIYEKKLRKEKYK